MINSLPRTVVCGGVPLKLRVLQRSDLDRCAAAARLDRRIVGSRAFHAECVTRRALAHEDNIGLQIVDPLASRPVPLSVETDPQLGEVVSLAVFNALTDAEVAEVVAATLGEAEICRVELVGPCEGISYDLVCSAR